MRGKIAALAADAGPDVKLQVAIAARKIEGVEPSPVLAEVLRDLWRRPADSRHCLAKLAPLLERQSDEFLRAVRDTHLAASPGLARFMPRVLEWSLTAREFRCRADCRGAVPLWHGGRGADLDVARRCLVLIASKIETGETRGIDLTKLTLGC